MVPDEPSPPLGIILGYDEALRLAEALVAAWDALRRAGLAPGLQDELLTNVIRLLRRMGFWPGGSVT